MKELKYKELGKGVVKRSEKRVLGVFIDGTGLDRATRRLARKVDMLNLIKGVSSGLTPVVAPYYTLIPFEDDSRHRAFLDAVSKAGLTVVVKRLPPKGITRQVSVDVEMASDIVSFALGHENFSSLSEYEYEGSNSNNYNHSNHDTQQLSHNPKAIEANLQTSSPALDEQKTNIKTSRQVVVVCPSRGLSYPISLLKGLNVDTISADFGEFSQGDILKSAAKWIDLSDSETIWKG